VVTAAAVVVVVYLQLVGWEGECEFLAHNLMMKHSGIFEYVLLPGCVGHYQMLLLHWPDIVQEFSRKG